MAVRINRSHVETDSPLNSTWKGVRETVAGIAAVPAFLLTLPSSHP